MWITTARQHISPEVTGCCISNAMDETDDYSMLWNGSEEEGNVRNEYKEDEDTDCEDGESDTDW